MIRVNISINREPRTVWAYITEPGTWQSWWGGGLSGVQPAWQTGGMLVWESGDTSPIDSLIPNKLLRIKAGTTLITFMLMPGSSASTVMEIEMDDPLGGESFDDGGAAMTAHFQQMLGQLKAGVESAAQASTPPPPPQTPTYSAPPSAPVAPSSQDSYQSFAPPAPTAPPAGGGGHDISGSGFGMSGPDFGASAGFGSGGGLGDTPPPQMGAPAGDDLEIRVSNTGQRAAVIVVLLLIAAAVVAGVVFLQRKQAAIEKHEGVKAAFQTAHNKGYIEFWKKVQVDVKGMKSNAEFEARLRANTTNPSRYAKHIKENALFILDESLPDYKAISANAPEYAEQTKAIVAAVESIRNQWDAFATEYIRFEEFGKANEKLEEASSHWLGWQQKPGTEKWKFNAVRYIKVLRCVFGKDKQWKDFEFTMESEVTNTCTKAAEKPEWFRRVAFECLPKLKEPPSEPDADFEAAVAAFKKTNDTTSKLGIDTCLKKSRTYFESEAIGKLAKPWVDYVAAQNALLDAIDANLKKLR